MTCSQVWERLASNEEHHNPTSPKPVSATTTSTTSLPTHISFSYDPSDTEERGDEEEKEDLPQDDKDDFQYVPVSSQSKLVQFQFLTFARQQQLDADDGGDKKKTKQDYDSDDDDDDDDDQEEEDDEEQEETWIGHPVGDDDEEDQEVVFLSYEKNTTYVSCRWCLESIIEKTQTLSIHDGFTRWYSCSHWRQRSNSILNNYETTSFEKT